MMMRVRALLLSALLAGLSSLSAQQCSAQYQVEPESAHHYSYRVRVVNQMGRPICVKIIPYGHSNYFHADLGSNQSATRDLWAGQRVLCVWDDRNGKLLIAAQVNIKRNGVLRIRQLAMAAGPGAAKEPSEMPSMEIESE
jgi:hypothetical protein